MTLFRLRAQLWLNRLGPLPAVALLLILLALWLHFFATHRIQQKIDGHRANVITMTSQGNNLDNQDVTHGKAEPSIRQMRYADFRSHLISKDDLPGIIRLLFAEASKNHLQLNRMDYKLGAKPGGQYRIYRLTAPIKGPYGDIQRFAKGILEKVPASALEEISFKRDNIATDATETKLRFAIFLKDGN